MGKKEERKSDIRTIKKNWRQRLLIISGFSLLLFYLFNLSLEDIIIKIPGSEEIFLILISVLTLSSFIEVVLRIKKRTLYEAFYSSYLTITLIFLSIIYWISYMHNIEVGVFRSLIVFIHILIFLHSLITIKNSEKMWYIVISYIFIVIITIIVFAYLYWTATIFETGFLQFNDCSKINPQLRSYNWFYFSSVTFFTLGYGDICPATINLRIISQIEAALGVLINAILIGFIFWKLKDEFIKKIEEKA